MKKQILLLVVFTFSITITMAQFNPVWMPDYPYLNTVSSTGAARQNVGIDYQGNTFGANWQCAVVTDYSSTFGGSALYLDWQAQPGTQKEFPVSGLDPDVVIIRNEAVVISYEIIGGGVNVYIDLFKDIQNNPNQPPPVPTPAPSSNGTYLVATFPLSSPSFTPVVNIDANASGQWVITYSESPSQTYYATGSGTASFMTPITFTPLSGAPGNEYVQPDVAIDDNGNAYLVALDMSNTSMNVFQLPGGAPIYTAYSGSIPLDEPRIACPPAATSPYSTDWAVAVVTDGVGAIDLHYMGGGNSYMHTLTNGASGLGTPTTLVAAPGGNSRPCISYNKDDCKSISVNWYNAGFGGIIGIEIESTSPLPLTKLRTWAGTGYNNSFFIPVSAGGGDASAVCGRYADTKAAGFVNGGQVMQHHIDCIGSWRIGKPHNNSANIQSKASSNTGFIITPNPATSNLILKMAEDLELNNAEIKIENVVGQEFSTQQLNKNVAEQNIDIDELPNGIYFIKVISNKNLLFTNKFVKQ